VRNDGVMAPANRGSNLGAAPGLQVANCNALPRTNSIASGGELALDPAATTSAAAMVSPKRRPRCGADAPAAVHDAVATAARVVLPTGGGALQAAVGVAAVRLRALRLYGGARVAVWRVCAADALALTFAASAAGVVLVWCNDRWAVAEVGRVLSDARPAAVLVGGRVDARAVCEELGGDGGRGGGGLAGVPAVFVLGKDDNDAAPGGGGGGGGGAVWEMVSEGRRDEGVDGDVEWPGGVGPATAPYAIFYTSGTTGEPKGVVLSHRAMLCQAQAKLAHVGFHAGTRYLALAPLFHLSGASSAIAVALAGGTFFLPGPRETTPVAWLTVIDRARINALVLVPSVLQMLVDAHDRAHSAAANSNGSTASDSSAAANAAVAAPGRSVDTILYGGGACTRGLRSDVLTRVFPNCRLIGAYGMTEAASSMTFIDHSRLPPRSRRHASVGCTPRHVTVAVRRVADSFRTERGGWLVGEVMTRGPHVMAGYFGQPAATRAALSSDGWLYTGDMGYVDDDGCLYIVGRIKDMIKTGGENVFAGEVEAVLGRHPAVISSAVVGVPHRVLGEAVCAAVVTASVEGGDGNGGGVSSEDLATWCRDRLSPFKRPKWIVPMDRFPSNPTGKVLKHELRSEVQRLLEQSQRKFVRAKL
jgi:acyl-CoA synthetase (AMP-forming)/AMP-acid ligase II